MEITLGLFAKLAAIAVALWLLGRLAFRLAVDRRFGAAVTGGRSGSITLKMGERSGRAEYEVGLKVDKMVYCSSVTWTDGSKMTDQEKALFVWGEVFGDRIIATAILDRLLHHAVTLNIRGNSYRLKEKLKAGLVRSADDNTPQPGGEI